MRLAEDDILYSLCAFSARGILFLQDWEDDSLALLPSFKLSDKK